MDYNIEYAHTYVGDDVGTEQEESIKMLQQTVRRLKKLKKTFVLSLLLDEYNSYNPSFKIEDFLVYLNNLDAKPDFLFLESKLVSDYKLILREMNSELKNEYIKYIEKRNKVPCSLLIAIWYLKRLGLMEFSKKEIAFSGKDEKEFVSKKIISILPKKYQLVEMKALEIIAATRFKEYLKNIIHIYF